MIVNGKIVRYKQGYLLIKTDVDILPVLQLQQPKTAEIRIDDGRSISVHQRKKIFAIIRDIAVYSGDDPEYFRRFLTWEYCSQREIEPFSLSEVDMSTASSFIDFLIEFCFIHNIPTKESLLGNSDDIDRYLYLCLKHRKCAICNMTAEVHHVNRIGMGRDREQVVHKGLLAISLCRTHHNAAHTNEKALFDRYHIHGIKLDDELCKKLSLRSD